jgi:hypothetical protein
MSYTTFTVNEYGNLVISLTEEGKSIIDEVIALGGSDEQLFIDLIEYQLSNGYSLVKPEDVGALTSSLLLSDGVSIWYYNYYAVVSYLADLKNYGSVVWTKC